MPLWILWIVAAVALGIAEALTLTLSLGLLAVAALVAAVVGALGMGLFVVFAIANILTFLFVLKWVPESRGRTLEELEEDVTTGVIYTQRRK